MKAKTEITKGNRKRRKFNKGKARLMLVFACLVVVAITVSAKGNSREVVGWKYDKGNTVWEMAQRNCPDDMTIRDFSKEIEKANDIKNGVIYKNWTYKIPVYETESDTLDMTKVIGYEASDEGVLLLLADGTGYFIEK